MIPTIIPLNNNKKSRKLLCLLYEDLKPIINKRNYNISNLIESPYNSENLGENCSNDTDSVIYLKLKSSNGLYLSFEEIMETFIHEICHCKFHNHNKKFWNLLSLTTIEYEKMKNIKTTLRLLAENELKKRNEKIKYLRNIRF